MSEEKLVTDTPPSGAFSAKIEPQFCDRCKRRMSGSYQHWYGVQVSYPAQGSSSTGEMYSYDTKEFFECYPELVNGLTLRLCIICWLRGQGIEPPSVAD